MNSKSLNGRRTVVNVIEVLLVAGIILGSWQLWISFGRVPAIVAPSPSIVGAGMMKNWQSLIKATGETIGVAILGLLIGLLLGYTVALLAWVNKFIGGLLLPAALIFQSVPVVALVPVIARIFGYDVRSVIAIAVLISFFPTYTLVQAGFDRPPPGSNDLFTVFGATRMQRLRYLAIPSAMPNFLTAIRLSAANCILATLVAEFLMGTQGLGYLIAFSAPRMDLQTGWGAATVALLISIIMFSVTSAFEERWGERWT